MNKFLQTADHSYFFKHCHKDGPEKIEKLAELPFFNDVYKYYKEFANKNKIAYLDNATDYIIEKLQLVISEDEKSNLKTYAFYCGTYLRNVKKNEHKDKMLKDGWIELTEDVVKQAISEKKKLEVSARMSSDWLSTSINQVYKPFYSEQTGAMLMKLRARTRGYYLHRFENAFCKLV